MATFACLWSIAKLRAGKYTFSDTFRIDQYDEKLNVLAHVTGEITGTRITVKTSPQSIF
jgi:hypothetical protein